MQVNKVTSVITEVLSPQISLKGKSFLLFRSVCLIIPYCYEKGWLLTTQSTIAHALKIKQANIQDA